MAFQLFSICKRYNFESKSQHLLQYAEGGLDCFRYVKDTILKANHNNFKHVRDFIKLFSICQRYNFESKSQHSYENDKSSIYCFRYVKDTILKANHNLICIVWTNAITVFDMSKIQFWKQITTLEKLYREASELFSICQRYNFESKSQPYGMN